MKIVLFNGSPRPQGNTAKMIAAFTEAAESAGHDVVRFDTCKMDIKGCLACEYCHGKGNGVCIQKDDMHRIYAELKDTELLVLAAPIYYHGISGQLKCAIDRFYSALYPEAPESLKYVAMFLASGDRNQYDGARFSFEGDFLGYLGLEDKGFFTAAGNVTEETLESIREMARGL
jgi:multimeric flavodoxin WrbA